MSLIGIAACTSDGIIGINDKIPWHYKEDFAFFKFMTTGNIVIMGGRTYRSIGKPLPNRKNVVISRKGGENKDNLEFIDIGNRFCMKAIESYSYKDEDIYICGGGEIYEMFFDHIDRWLITTVVDDLLAVSPGLKTKINVEKIKSDYKKLAEIKLSDRCKVEKYDRIFR